MGGVLGVAAAVVEKEADIMCTKDLDHALVLPAMLLNRSELVAAGAERRPRSMLKRGDRTLRLDARVDEVFGQGADDAVATGQNFADLRGMTACGL